MCMSSSEPKTSVPVDIQSLGEGWRYDLIRPVLESCTPNTLKRFEEADPVRTLFLRSCSCGSGDGLFKYIANETAGAQSPPPSLAYPN